MKTETKRADLDAQDPPPESDTAQLYRVTAYDLRGGRCYEWFILANTTEEATRFAHDDPKGLPQEIDTRLTIVRPLGLQPGILSRVRPEPQTIGSLPCL